MFRAVHKTVMQLMISGSATGKSCELFFKSWKEKENTAKKNISHMHLRETKNTAKKNISHMHLRETKGLNMDWIYPHGVVLN
jgi:hypothetical protein